MSGDGGAEASAAGAATLSAVGSPLSVVGPSFAAEPDPAPAAAWPADIIVV